MKRIILVLIGLLFINSVFASDIKIGVLDPSAVLAQAKVAIAMRGIINNKFAAESRSITKLQGQVLEEKSELIDIMGKSRSYDSLVTADKMSYNVLSAKYQKDSADLRQKIVRFIEKQRNMQSFAIKLVVKEMGDVIKQVSIKNNYDLILNPNGIVYAKDQDDITNLVIKELNKLDSQKLINNLKAFKVDANTSHN